MESESEFIEHIPCDECGSSDANSLFSDGHEYCFSCERYKPPSGEARGERRVTDQKEFKPVQGEYKDLAKRGIREDTCKFLDYRVGRFGDKPCQIANYYEDGRIVSQKIRFPGKDFTVNGKNKSHMLFGEQRFKEGGRRLVITEGEIDALSVSQVFGNKWPVVSVPNGAQGADKSIAKRIEFVEKFDKVIFAFDMDEPGREAAEKCAKLLPPGKAAIAHLPAKDPNECLQQGLVKQLTSALWEAKEYRPDGILELSDIKDKLKEKPEMGFPWFLPELNEFTYGRRLSEVVGLGAGTGVGKTDLITQQAVYDATELNEPVALYFLEQQPAETGKRMAGKYAGKRFHIPDDDSWTMDDLINAVDGLSDSGKIFLYDSWGATEWDAVKTRMTYNAMVNGVQFHYLDHLTALAAAEQNEREALEFIMADMAKLAKRLNIWILYVSHLSTPDGKPHEEGGRVMIRHFKGSRAIGFWTHFLIGLERDQQAEDPAVRHVTTFRWLKDRYTGMATGKTHYLGHDDKTGLLHITDPPPEEGSKSGGSSPFEEDGEF